MADELFQLILYKNGTIRAKGAQPDNMGEVLRILAEAADAGKIAWVKEDE